MAARRSPPLARWCREESKIPARKTSAQDGPLHHGATPEGTSPYSEPSATSDYGLRLSHLPRQSTGSYRVLLTICHVRVRARALGPIPLRLSNRPALVKSFCSDYGRPCSRCRVCARNGDHQMRPFMAHYKICTGCFARDEWFMT